MAWYLKDSDDFTRSNEDPLSDSGKWVQGGNPTAGTLYLKLLSNHVTNSDTASWCGAIRTGGASLGNDQRCEYDASTGSAGQYIWYVRDSNIGASENNYGCYCHTTTGSNSAIFKFVSGSFTQLGSITSVLMNGHNGILEVVGTTIKFYKDDVEQISRTDSAVTSGDAGIGVNRGVEDDSLKVDNWQAYDTVAPTSIPIIMEHLKQQGVS